MEAICGQQVRMWTRQREDSSELVVVERDGIGMMLTSSSFKERYKWEEIQAH